MNELLNGDVMDIKNGNTSRRGRGALSRHDSSFYSIVSEDYVDSEEDLEVQDVRLERRNSTENSKYALNKSSDNTGLTRRMRSASSASILATAKLQSKLEMLEEENKKLRGVARKYKRKYEQEMEVNKELGKRVRRWKEECKIAENECRRLEAVLMMQKNMLQISPVSTLASPEVSPAQFGQLEVEVDFHPPAKESDDKLLFTQVLIAERGDAGNISYCYPESKREKLPQNLHQFCFPSTQGTVDHEHKDFRRQVFVFVLSGETCATPLTTNFSSIDDVTYGVCTLTKDDKCICVLTKHPYFDAHCQILERLQGMELTETMTDYLDAVTDDVKSIDFSRALPGFTISTPNLAWAWPVDCVNRFDLLSDWGLEVLLERLPLDQILFLLGCLLLELKVVFVSSDLNRLSASILGLFPLLRPCQWVQPFIPILPQSLSVVCEAPVPVFVGTVSMPTMEDPTNEEDVPPPDATGNIFSRSGHQEAVVVHLDTSSLELSPALATSYHALKLPGLSELCHMIPQNDKSVSTRKKINQEVKKHLTSLLTACKYFGQSAATLAVASTLPPKVINEAEECLGDIVPLLRRGISSPWQYLARLQTTQMFMQWLETTKASTDKRFQLTSLLSPTEEDVF